MTVATARLVFFMVTFAIYPPTMPQRYVLPVVTKILCDTMFYSVVFSVNSGLRFRLNSNCSTETILARVRLRKDMNEIVMKELVTANTTGKSTV